MKKITAVCRALSAEELTDVAGGQGVAVGWGRTLEAAQPALLSLESDTTRERLTLDPGVSP